MAKKICCACKKLKPEDDFPWRSRAEGTRQGRCKPCCRIYSKAHYAEHRASYLAKAKTHNKAMRQRNRAQLRQIKEAHACADCGVTYPPYVLDMAQKPGRVYRYSVGELVTSASGERLRRELTRKFDIICANCNRIRRFSAQAAKES